MYEQRIEELLTQKDPMTDSDCERLRSILREMRLGGFAPTKSSSSQIIKAFVRVGDSVAVWEFLEYLSELGWKITTRDTEMILRMLWKQESVLSVADLHDRLTKRSPLTKQFGDISLAIHVRLADFQGAEKVLLRMKMQKLRADAVTYFAMTGSKFDANRSGPIKATLSSILGAVRSRQVISAEKRSRPAVGSLPPTDNDRRVLRGVLKTLTTPDDPPQSVR